MVAALPVPGFITKSLRHTQQEKMRRVSSFLRSSSLTDCPLALLRRTVAFNLSLRVSPFITLISAQADDNPFLSDECDSHDQALWMGTEDPAATEREASS